MEEDRIYIIILLCNPRMRRDLLIEPMATTRLLNLTQWMRLNLRIG